MSRTNKSTTSAPGDLAIYAKKRKKRRNMQCKIYRGEIPTPIDPNIRDEDI
jgi:hypothetical protein